MGIDRENASHAYLTTTEVAHFAERAEVLGGYDICELGRVVYNA